MPSPWENLATSRLNITYLVTAQLASTQKAWPLPDDRQLVLALFGTETPCDGLSPNARIMFFAAAIGGRLYGRKQMQPDA
jgi:hypothetical protein